MFRGTLIRSGNNAKTVKGDKLGGYETGIMYLAPFTAAGMGNVCPMAATAKCAAGCLYTAGRGRMTNVQVARQNKTKRYFANRAAFMAEMVTDLEAFVRYCAKRNVKAAVRLNGTSDIQWESGHNVTRNGGMFPSVFEAFPEVEFYDYTKVYNRTRKSLPANYRLTLSYSEANRAYSDAVKIAATETGTNVAVVFRDKATRDGYMASGFEGIEVLDGDQTDMRFLDPSDRVYVIGLYAKGSAKTDFSGFVVD